MLQCKLGSTTLQGWNMDSLTPGRNSIDPILPLRGMVDTQACPPRSPTEIFCFLGFLPPPKVVESSRNQSRNRFFCDCFFSVADQSKPVEGENEISTGRSSRNQSRPSTASTARLVDDRRRLVVALDWFRLLSTTCAALLWTDADLPAQVRYVLQ